MLLLKGCPRCHGDLMLVTYMEGRSTNCLQCGFSRELPPARSAEPRPIARPRLAPLPAQGA